MLETFFRNSSLAFRARAPERDAELMETQVNNVASALHHAVREIEAQRDGLRRRLDAVITRAAVIGGNDIDESLTRDETDAAVLTASDAEIARAETRLKTLERQLSDFKTLVATLHSLFPDFKASALGSYESTAKRL